MKKNLILICLLCFFGKLYSQANDFKIISSINIAGNKHTKSYIIQRELPFEIGDTVLNKNIKTLLLKAKTQVYNSNLFIEVKVDSTTILGNIIAINIDVKERWYIFPTPEFKLTDRSFSEWYKTFNADFNRVVYGLDFTHNNFSGRRDKFNVSILNGYARNIGIGYSNPYSNTKLTEGFGVYGSYTENKEMIYNTSANNKTMGFKNGGFVRKSINLGASYSRRKNFFKRTSITINANYIQISDSILNTIYNSNYFASNNNKQFILDVGYFISYANTDKNAYPLKGTKYFIGVNKKGLGLSGGINSTTLSGFLNKFYSHSHNFYSNIKIAGLIRAPFKQAYINQRAIGYGNLNMRGLELYVVDGVASTVLNYTFSKRLTSFKIPIPFNIKALPNIPIAIYAKTYTDMGYSYLPKEYNTKLNTKFLYTGGVGVDIITIYDLILKIEFSFNQLKQKGLFLQGSSNF